MSAKTLLFIQIYTDEHIIPQLARILRTRGYFVRLDRQWAADNRTHAGIIISPQFSRQWLSQVLQPLSRLLDPLTADELCNQVVFLQQFGAHRPRIAETRAEYEAGLVSRGSVADLMAEVAEIDSTD